MSFYPDVEVLSDDGFAVAATLEPDEGVALLLHSLIGSLERMPLADALRMRAEIARRFGGRYCRSDTCALMAELIDGHLEAVAGKSAPLGPRGADAMTVATRDITRVACADRLPPIGATVIVYSENTGPHRGMYTSEGVWRDDFDSIIHRVSHWWPLAVLAELKD